MISQLIIRTAGMNKPDAAGAYYPRPSNAGPERCIRQMVYQAHAAPIDRQYSDRMMAVFDDGHWHEELTNDLIRRTGTYKIHSEQMGVDCMTLDFMSVPEPLTDSQRDSILERIRAGDYSSEGFDVLVARGYKYCEICDSLIETNRLHGHIDGVVTTMEGEDLHYEHKGLNHFRFESIFLRNDWPLDYIAQTCLYQSGLRKLNPDIKRSLLVIKNKNTAQYMDIVIEYDDATDKAHIVELEHSNGTKITASAASPIITFDDILGNIHEKYRIIWEHQQNKTIPWRPFPPGTDFPCGYCQYEETCWRNYKAEFEALATGVTLDPELGGLLKQLKDLKAKKSGLEKQIKEMEATAKEALVGLDVREGSFSDESGQTYTFTHKTVERAFAQMDLMKAKLEQDIFEQVTKMSYWTELRIREFKERKKK